MLKNSRKTAIALGVLFLVVMVSWAVGYALSEQILSTPDDLSGMHSQKGSVLLSVVFELIDIAAIIGIIVIMYPLFKVLDERLSVWYTGFRIIESVLLSIGILCFLALISIGGQHINGMNGDAGEVQLIGHVLLSIRVKWVHLILPFFYSSAAFVFYYFFYKTKLIPRFISIIGIIAAVLLLAGIPMDFFEFKPGAFVGALGGINELLLSAWLIIKGFNKNALDKFKTLDQ